MALPASSVSSLHDIVVDLYIGLAPDDLGEPQQVLITVHVHHCVGPSIHNDDVVGTFDLQCLSAAIRSAVANQRYDLIESVVDDVARITTSFPGCESVEVDVRKPRTTGCLLVRIPADYPPFTVILSVGSNINPVENIPRAIRALRKMFDVRRVSKAYATPPVGEGAGTANFVNLAVELQTPLMHAGGLLTRALRAIEAGLGRTRDPANKAAPRPIDLDVGLLTGGAPQHAFVAEDGPRHAYMAVPLAELVPEFALPHGTAPGNEALGAPPAPAGAGARDGPMTLLEVSRHLTHCADPFSYFPVVPIDLCPSPAPRPSSAGALHRLQQIISHYDYSGEASRALQAKAQANRPASLL